MTAVVCSHGVLFSLFSRLSQHTNCMDDIGAMAVLAHLMPTCKTWNDVSTMTGALPTRTDDERVQLCSSFSQHNREIDSGVVDLVVLTRQVKSRVRSETKIRTTTTPECLCFSDSYCMDVSTGLLGLLSPSLFPSLSIFLYTFPHLHTRYQYPSRFYSKNDPTTRHIHPLCHNA